MNVALGSAFRNSAWRLDCWFAQARQLRDGLRALEHSLELIMVWGDCADATPGLLKQKAHALGVPWQAPERSHGGPVYASTEAADRMAALSYVGDGIVGAVGAGVDALLYVESDLRWTAATMLALLDDLRRPSVSHPTDAPGAVSYHVDVCAPLVFAGPHFYDVWGHRGLDGSRFSPFPPYHATLRHDGALTEVSSVGSCLAMRGEVARRCRMNGGCLVGFCADARAKGYRVWVDAQLRVDHPA